MLRILIGLGVSFGLDWKVLDAHFAMCAPVSRLCSSPSATLASSRNVAGTGAAIASTADMAARAVVAPNPGGEAQNNLGHSDARERHLSTEAMVALKQRMVEGRLQGEDSGPDHPATELYDNARRRAADFNQNNPVFVATPPEIPAVDTSVSLFDGLQHADDATEASMNSREDTVALRDAITG